MIDSPNDMDPPDYVVGGSPEEALYEAIYEKFPWIEDEDGYIKWNRGKDKRGDIDEMLKFVIGEAHKQGCEDTNRGVSEYIHYLESEVEILKDLTKTILTANRNHNA